MVESLSAAVYATDAEGRITFFNKAAAAMWGRWPELGEDWWCGSWRLYWPDGRPMAHDECPMAISLRTGEAIEGMEAMAERPDGTRFPFLAYPTPLRDASGALAGAVNMLVDITEQKRSGERLHDSEARYRNLFESVRASVWHEDFSAVLDMLDDLRADGVTDLRAFLEAHPDRLTEAIRRVRIIDVNDYTLALFEASHKKTLLASLSDIFIPETGHAFIDELVALWEGHRYIESETAVRTLKGRRLDIMFTIAFEGERCERTFVTILDITGRKKAELAWKQYAAIVESSDDSIVSEDLNGIILSWNKGAERLFGYSAEEEAVGRPITILFPADSHDDEGKILARVKRGERIENYETIRVRKDGRPVEISLSVSPVKDVNGNIVGASKIARDISRIKEAERALHAERERLFTLNHVAQTISSGLDLEQVVQTVTDTATELSGAKFGAFFYNVTDDDGESLMLYTLSGAPREAFEKFGLPRNTAVFEPTFRGTGVVRSDDIQADPRYGKNAPHKGMPKGHLPVVSYLAVPVKSRSGEVLGGLFFGHPEPGVFSEDSELLVKGIAAHAAIAIDNARLHEDARREIEQRRRAEEGKELLMKELKHRARNTLAMVQSLAAQTFRTGGREEHIAFVARLQALAQAYDLLTAHQGQRATVGELARRALAPFHKEHDSRVKASGREAWLNAEKSVLLTMALHELATNAVKYGALSNKRGRVRVEWKLTGRGNKARLRLDWRESGGPPVTAPARKGFGTKLIERALRDGDGDAQFEFARGGFKCTLVLSQE